MKAGPHGTTKPLPRLGSRLADLRASRPTAGLKAQMRELSAQHFKRYPVLQSQEYRSSKLIHQSRDGRALLRYGDEDLSS